jgi:hypothetical protein
VTRGTIETLRGLGDRADLSLRSQPDEPLLQLAEAGPRGDGRASCVEVVEARLTSFAGKIGEVRRGAVPLSGMRLGARSTRSNREGCDVQAPPANAQSRDACAPAALSVPPARSRRDPRWEGPLDMRRAGVERAAATPPRRAHRRFKTFRRVVARHRFSFGERPTPNGCVRDRRDSLPRESEESASRLRRSDRAPSSTAATTATCGRFPSSSNTQRFSAWRQDPRRKLSMKDVMTHRGFEAVGIDRGDRFVPGQRPVRAPTLDHPPITSTSRHGTCCS